MIFELSISSEQYHVKNWCMLQMFTFPEKCMNQRENFFGVEFKFKIAIIVIH